jgi:hypothetical protein
MARQSKVSPSRVRCRGSEPSASARFAQEVRPSRIAQTKSESPLGMFPWDRAPAATSRSANQGSPVESAAPRALLPSVATVSARPPASINRNASAGSCRWMAILTGVRPSASRISGETPVCSSHWTTEASPFRVAVSKASPEGATPRFFSSRWARSGGDSQPTKTPATISSGSVRRQWVQAVFTASANVATAAYDARTETWQKGLRKALLPILPL